MPTIEGEWVPQSAELGGRPYPVENFAGATLKLTAESYDFAGDKGTCQTDDGMIPAQMDIHGVEGPNAGRDIAAIYKLADNELVVCYQLGTGDRPSEFRTEPGTQEFLVHYMKKK